MKALIFTHADGSRWFCALVPRSFDTQAWVDTDQQRENFRLLGIVAVQEHVQISRENHDPIQH